MILFKVFVYGTLKRNQPNYFLLRNLEKGYARFIGEASTLEKYPLVIATKSNIPFLLEVPGVGEHVQGEIFEVDDIVLNSLDILEGYPDYYMRKNIKLMTPDKQALDDDGILCYILPRSRFPDHILKYPTMSSYDSLGPHGRPYIDSETWEEEADDPDLLVVN